MMRESRRKGYPAVPPAFRGAMDADSSRNAQAERIEWEMRPGGMLVQKRDENADHSVGPLIRIRVSHGNVYHEVSISPYATFGDLKKLLVQPTGLQAREQRILYRGKEKESGDFLHLVGVKDKAKVVLIEDPASRERRQEDSRHDDRVSKATRAVSTIKSEVDKLAERVLAMESRVHKRVQVPDSEFESLTEELMMLLLKLDGIEAVGDAKSQRRIQVRRAQKFVEALDSLKAKKNSGVSPSLRSPSPAPAPLLMISSPSSSSSSTQKSVVDNPNSAIVSMKWETFETCSTPPVATTVIETDWERALFT